MARPLCRLAPRPLAPKAWAAKAVARWSREPALAPGRTDAPRRESPRPRSMRSGASWDLKKGRGAPLGYWELRARRPAQTHGGGRAECGRSEDGDDAGRRFAGGAFRAPTWLGSWDGTEPGAGSAVGRQTACAQRRGEPVVRSGRIHPSSRPNAICPMQDTRSGRFIPGTPNSAVATGLAGPPPAMPQPLAASRE
jgi:hypothetical protein